MKLDFKIRCPSCQDTLYEARGASVAPMIRRALRGSATFGCRNCGSSSVLQFRPHRRSEPAPGVLLVGLVVQDKDTPAWRDVHCRRST